MCVRACVCVRETESRYLSYNTQCQTGKCVKGTDYNVCVLKDQTYVIEFVLI